MKLLQLSRWLASALVLCVVPGLVLGTFGGSAQAATPGRACMFNAPGGALLQGHVGWAFRKGTADIWVFGATENTSGTWTVAAGDPAATQSWQSTGTFADALHAFGSGSNYNRGGNYYTQYRCRNITSSNPAQASNQAIAAARSGYNLPDNNCLTKSVDIMRAYGVPNLPPATVGSTSGSLGQPNSYFNNNLAGFEATQKLRTTLSVGVLLNDPVSKTPINTNPVHRSRPMRVQIFNASNQLAYDTTVTAQATAGTARYSAVLQLPDSWPGGVYAPAFMVKVQLDYTLFKYTPGIALIQHGVNNTVPDTSLIVGDVDRNNTVNTNDYNILMACFSDLAPPKGPCSSEQKRASDLNDDGLVNGIDYNLYLRVVQNLGGG